ncbi:hypothetical protein J7J12_02290 [bacterium]|nr:hypothetical protein [bacterium]
MTGGPNFDRFRTWEGEIIQIKSLPRKIAEGNINLEKEIEIPLEIREHWEYTAAAGRAYIAVHPKGIIQFCTLKTNNEAAKQAVMQQLKEKGYYKSKNKSWKYYPFQNQKEKIKVTIKKSPSGTEIQVQT